MLVVVGSMMWRAGETSWQFLAASAVFLPNIALLAGWWTTGPLAVLWSLGVEEQVYLVWPFLVRVFRREAGMVVRGVGLVEPFLRYTTFTAGWLLKVCRSRHGSASTASPGEACLRSSFASRT